MIALAWPTHVAHERSLRWFERRGGEAWATCPLTQLAFVRILSNPAFSPDALSVAEAAQMLGDSTADPAHVFWADDLNLNEAIALAAESLQGHKQLTDAYLIGLARNRKGRLATLDKAVAGWARDREWVEIV